MDIYIYVYTFKFLWFFNLLHTEIKYGGYYVGYGPHGLNVSQFAPRMKLKRIVYAGNSNTTMQDYVKLIQKLEISLYGKKYCFFTNNCRHITLQILQGMRCDQNDGW